MERFTKAAFDKADPRDRDRLAAELSGVLQERLRRAGEFHDGVKALVADLRALGHDLWSFDESDEMEVWCPNYQRPTGPGIVVTFTTEGVHVEYSTTGDEP